MSSSKQLATLQEHLNTGAPNPNQPDTNQRILDEDAYVDTLEHIITRDFYPDLFRLNKQNQHIDKYDHKLFISTLTSTISQYPCTISNSSSINRYGTPLQQNLTPTPIKQYQEYQKRKKKGNENTDKHESTPSKSFEAPTPTPIRDNHNHKHADDEDSDDGEEDDEDEDLVHYVNGEMLTDSEKSRMKLMNLQQFQNVYTSEDNYSFSEIMYKNQLQHFKKYPWIYEQQKNADDRQKYLSIMSSRQSDIHANKQDKDNPKAITSSTDNIKAIQHPSSALSQSKPKPEHTSIPQDEHGNNLNARKKPEDKQISDHKSKQEIMDDENEKKYKQEQALKKKVDLYKGELEYWKFKAVNKLMFFPESDRERNIQIMKQLHNEYGKPECNYTNTRLPKEFVLKPDDRPKLSEMEKNLKGYDMVSTPQIRPGESMGDDEDNIEHTGTPFITWGELGGTPIALDDDDRPIGPIFHVPKVPKRDKIVDALNKKATDKLRKRQEEKLRNTTPRTTEIYTPYSTKRIITPSGNHIDTPLVGMNTPSINRSNKNKNKRKRKRSVLRTPNTPSMGRYHARSIEDLSPAARKLMQKNMKNGNKLSTPLSSKLRQAYSMTPTPNNRKRTRESSLRRKVNEDTPSLVVGGYTPKQKKRKRHHHKNKDKNKDKNNFVFAKPKGSIRDRMNITDGLL